MHICNLCSQQLVPHSLLQSRLWPYTMPLVPPVQSPHISYAAPVNTKSSTSYMWMVFVSIYYINQNISKICNTVYWKLHAYVYSSESSCLRSYDSRIYINLCNQFHSPLMLRGRMLDIHSCRTLYLSTNYESIFPITGIYLAYRGTDDHLISEQNGFTAVIQKRQILVTAIFSMTIFNTFSMHYLLTVNSISVYYDK